jgi:outer membrane protein insertion porin family
MIRMPRGMNGLKAALLAILIVAGLAPCLLAVDQPPAGKEVAEVIVSGNRRRSTEEILAKMNTRPGLRYSEVTAQEDVGRLLREGWFLANGVTLTPQERPDGKLTVYVTVTELPNTVQSIVYNGANHLGPDELKKLTNLAIGMPMSPAVNQAARQAILRKYQENGRIWAGVTLTEGGRLEDTRIVFDIIEGPTAKISSIDIEHFGPSTSEISESRLITQLNSSRAYLGTLIGGEYEPGKLDSDVVKLSDYFQKLGYLNVKVQRELIWSPDHRSVKIIFHVEEGKRFTVGRIQIDGNKSQPEEKLIGFTDLRAGDYYDKFKAQADLDRIKKFLGYQGRFVQTRETLAEGGDGVVNVHYQIEEKEPVRIQDVKIIGNSVTRDQVIRRQLNLYPGQILSYPDLVDAERAIARLGLFEDDIQTGVKPTVEVENPEENEPYKNILVKVKEKPTGSFMIGAGITSDAGLTGSIVLNERNFDICRFPRTFDEVLEGQAWRGAGQEFRIEAVPGTEFQRYTMSFREPYLFDSNYSGGVSGYYYTRIYTEYYEERYGGRLTLGRRLSNLWTVSLTERIEEVNLSNIVPGEPIQIAQYAGNSFVAGTRLNFTRDERDNVLRPGSGSLIDFGAEWVTGTYTFPLASASASQYWTLFERKDGSGKQVLAFKSQVEWAGDNTPVFERYYAGGFNSLRGFEFRGVGPMAGPFNLGGDFGFLNSLEYQIPVLANDNLYFVAFVDSGTVEATTTIKDYRVAAGIGIRVSIPQLLGPVPLAFDFALPINQAPGDHRQVFSFFLGFFN